MKELWIYEKNGVRRRAVECVCKQCGETFLRRMHRKRSFCSPACRGAHKHVSNSVEIVCFNCGKKFRRPISKINHTRHGFQFCSRKCKDQAQSMDGNCPGIRPSHYGTSNGKELYANLIKRAKNPVCIDCGEKRVYLLTVHHIDGNRENNPRDCSNFEIVCGSCHMKRHLWQKEDGNWSYWTKTLTPREMLSKL